VNFTELPFAVSLPKIPCEVKEETNFLLGCPRQAALRESLLGAITPGFALDQLSFPERIKY